MQHSVPVGSSCSTVCLQCVLLLDTSAQQTADYTQYTYSNLKSLLSAVVKAKACPLGVLPLACSSMPCVCCFRCASLQMPTSSTEALFLWGLPVCHMTTTVLLLLLLLSSSVCRSADVYEFSTETLFFGRQDAMQRTTLLPVADYIRSTGLDPAFMQIAEVGCGTGRFHTFIKVSSLCLHMGPW